MSEPFAYIGKEKDLGVFSEHVWAEGKRLYRDLPWRNVDDPYQVLVSEVMLQQTQVKRVKDYWTRFISLFPTLDALAAADTALVLEVWQGLGYNRRALALKQTAEKCSTDYQGLLPDTLDELVTLPGIGKATAAGVFVFAYQRPAVYLETNVRAVFIHEFFPESEEVRDHELLPLIEATCSQGDPRGWYYALLDYGADLKQRTVNPSRKSAHYHKQSVFSGSRRQKRAEILRCVLDNPGITSDELYERLNRFEKKEQREPVEGILFNSIIDDLLKEGFFRQEGDIFFA